MYLAFQMPFNCSHWHLIHNRVINTTEQRRHSMQSKKTIQFANSVWYCFFRQDVHQFWHFVQKQMIVFYAEIGDLLPPNVEILKGKFGVRSSQNLQILPVWLKRSLKSSLFSAESVSNFITCISEARCLQEVPICVCFSISFQDAIGLTRLMQLKTTEAAIGFIENAHRLPPSLKISKVSRMNTECNSIEK